MCIYQFRTKIKPKWQFDIRKNPKMISGIAMGGTSEIVIKIIIAKSSDQITIGIIIETTLDSNIKKLGMYGK